MEGRSYLSRHGPAFVCISSLVLATSVLGDGEVKPSRGSTCRWQYEVPGMLGKTDMVQNEGMGRSVVKEGILFGSRENGKWQTPWFSKPTKRRTLETRVQTTSPFPPSSLSTATITM